MFKIGDRVKVIADTVDGKNIIEKVGTVKQIPTSHKCNNWNLVEFDENIGGHMVPDYGCTKGHGWFVPNEKLKLISQKSIHIYANDLTTTAVIKENGKVIKTATAKCNPSDTYDFEVGAKLAFERLMDNEVIEVKRPAKVGEYIKIVDSDNNCTNDYKNGDILLVVKADKKYSTVSGNPAFYKNERYKYARLEEYVVLENYKPTEKVEFKPHLLCTKCNKEIGTIGEEKPYNDKFGNKINIGDVGFIVSKNTTGVVTKDICCKGSYEHFEDIIIVKKYGEIKNGEIIDEVKYVKEEN